MSGVLLRDVHGRHGIAEIGYSSVIRVLISGNRVAHGKLTDPVQQPPRFRSYGLGYPPTVPPTPSELVTQTQRTEKKPTQRKLSWDVVRVVAVYSVVLQHITHQAPINHPELG